MKHNKTQFLTIRPTNDVPGPQVLRSEPVFERSEVLPQRGRVQSTLADGFLQGVLPRHRRPLLHNSPANDNSLLSGIIQLQISTIKEEVNPQKQFKTQTNSKQPRNSIPKGLTLHRADQLPPNLFSERSSCERPAQIAATLAAN